MAALISKPGISGVSVLSIPKQWDPNWFRDFINNLLKGADVRNATSPTGTIKIGGNISTPYGTLDLNTALNITFTGHITITGSTLPTNVDLTLSGTDYQLALFAPGAAVDEKWWFLRNANGTFALTTLNDTLAAGVNAILITRTGNLPTAYQFYGPQNGGGVDVTADKGTFTGTLTGVVGVVTGTITWRKMGNFIAMLGSLQGTSNATACTITGVPAFLAPATRQIVTVSLEDNSTNCEGCADMGGLANTIQFFRGVVAGTSVGHTTTGFTNVNTKGMNVSGFMYLVA